MGTRPTGCCKPRERRWKGTREDRFPLSNLVEAGLWTLGCVSLGLTLSMKLELVAPLLIAAYAAIRLYTKNRPFSATLLTAVIIGMTYYMWYPLRFA